MGITIDYQESIFKTQKPVEVLLRPRNNYFCQNTWSTVSRDPVPLMKDYLQYSSPMCVIRSGWEATRTWTATETRRGRTEMPMTRAAMRMTKNDDVRGCEKMTSSLSLLAEDKPRFFCYIIIPVAVYLFAT